MKEAQSQAQGLGEGMDPRGTPQILEHYQHRVHHKVNLG